MNTALIWGVNKCPKGGKMLIDDPKYMVKVPEELLDKEEREKFQYV